MRTLLLRLVVGAVVIIVLAANPASALSVQPGDTLSVVVGIDPPTDAVDAEILGRDALVQLTVQPGHEVIVSGYDNEPYLRINPDGTVETNLRSPAVSLNRTQSAASGPSDDADAAAPPNWQHTGDGGQVSWHDHRAHAMVPQPVGSTVAWTIPLTVDGAPATLDGEITRVPSPSPLPWLLVALAVAVAALALGRRWAGPASVATAGAAAAIALVVGSFDRTAIPVAAGRPIGFLAAPAIALLLAVIAAPLKGRPRLIAVLASVSALGGWLVVRIGALSEPLLVTGLPTALDRALIAVVLGLTVAAGGLAVTSAGTEVGGGRSTRRGRARMGR